MDKAINALKVSLDMVETNCPINLVAGNTKQAMLEAETAVEIRKAINYLESYHQAKAVVQ